MGRDEHCLGIVIDAAIQFEQLATSLALASGLVDLFAPCTVEGTIQVDPRNQPVPVFRIEFDVVVSFLEHLHQLRGVGVKLHRLEHVIVALDTGPSHKTVQFSVANRKFSSRFSIATVARRDRLPVGKFHRAA